MLKEAVRGRPSALYLVRQDALVTAIKENEIDSITGHIKFDEDNNPRANVYIIQIKGGEYTTYKKMSLRREQ